jgi:hypothetical protein
LPTKLEGFRIDVSTSASLKKQINDPVPPAASAQGLGIWV